MDLLSTFFGDFFSLWFYLQLDIKLNQSRCCRQLNLRTRRKRLMLLLLVVSSVVRAARIQYASCIHADSHRQTQSHCALDAYYAMEECVALLVVNRRCGGSERWTLATRSSCIRARTTLRNGWMSLLLLSCNAFDCIGIYAFGEMAQTHARRTDLWFCALFTIFEFVWIGRL